MNIKKLSKTIVTALAITVLGISKYYNGSAWTPVKAVWG